MFQVESYGILKCKQIRNISDIRGISLGVPHGSIFHREPSFQGEKIMDQLKRFKSVLVPETETRNFLCPWRAPFHANA